MALLLNQNQVCSAQAAVRGGFQELVQDILHATAKLAICVVLSLLSYRGF